MTDPAKPTTATSPASGRRLLRNVIIVAALIEALAITIAVVHQMRLWAAQP